MSTRKKPLRRRTAVPLPTPAAWIGARARNALRRPFFIGVVSIITFATALLALVIVPQQARKAAAAIRPVAARPDTEPSAAALVEAERQLAQAESSLVATRNQLTQLVTATAVANASDTTTSGDTVTPQLRSRRDSLASQVDVLGKLIARSENAPLLASYRALAQAGPMQGDPRVKQLLDSLVEIERERESYNAAGGVDPVFVALTARANELGRNIESMATARRTAMRTELAGLEPPPPVLPASIASKPLPDTLERIRERDAARTVALNVAARLARERAELLRFDQREERARELANVGASPSAMLAAALVFGAVLGFGVALFDEVRRPRLADAWEAERATGVRVLGTIKPIKAAADRTRRSADNGPLYIDPGADGHQLVYQSIAIAGTGTVMLTVTGDSPAVSAVIAINFAAIASDEARTTLLIDTDTSASTVMAALRLRPGAGVSEVARGSAMWGEVTRNAQLGRDRTIDVVPSGSSGKGVEELVGLFQRDATRLSRQYDAIVLVSAPAQVTAGLATALPIPDVVYCVRAGETSIAELKAAIEAIRASGATPRGIVFWNAPDPVLAELRPTEERERETAAV